MELTPGPGSGDTVGLKLDLLRTAADLYLRLAYPAGDYPEAVRRRLAWPEAVGAEELLTQAPFERVGRPQSQQGPVYALRLGNHRYPHMKLQIQPWPNVVGFMLSVNTHDQVSMLDEGSADAQAFRDLQAENQRLKEAIEDAWDEAGLPTFLRYLREYIHSRNSEAADSHEEESVRPGAASHQPLA